MIETKHVVKLFVFSFVLWMFGLFTINNVHASKNNIHANKNLKNGFDVEVTITNDETGETIY